MKERVHTFTEKIFVNSTNRLVNIGLFCVKLNQNCFLIHYICFVLNHENEHEKALKTGKFSCKQPENSNLPYM